MSVLRTLLLRKHILFQKKEITMGRLIIDGNSVFEIDEECMKRRKPIKECDIDKYYQEKDVLNDENSDSIYFQNKQ